MRAAVLAAVQGPGGPRERSRGCCGAGRPGSCSAGVHPLHRCCLAQLDPLVVAIGLRAIINCSYSLYAVGNLMSALLCDIL